MIEYGTRDSLYSYIPALTLKRSSRQLPCPPGSSYPEVVINGHTIRWPKFQINNVMFESTCEMLGNVIIE